MSPITTIKLILSGVAAFIALFFVLNSFTVIDQTERGILTKFGEVQTTLEPGLHFVNPFTSDVHKMDVTVQALEINDLTYSKDSQVVGVTAVVNYQIDPTRVAEVWTEVRKDAEVRYVVPRSKESLKEVISAYTAQGIIDSRAVLSGEFKSRVIARLEGEGLIVGDVSITNFDFDDSYEAAVANKQVQEQQALAQINITSQEAEKKKQEILRAEALSEKTRLEVQALTAGGDDIIRKIQAEAQLEAAKRWNGATPSTMIVSGEGSDLPLLPYLNVGR